MEKQDIIKSFKDSLFTGLIALALFGPIVGLRSASKGEGLFITPQWGVVFLLVGLCILGRFLININFIYEQPTITSRTLMPIWANLLVFYNNFYVTII